MKSREGTTVGVFRIGAIAERYGIHPQTLRMYEREGLLRPARGSPGEPSATGAKSAKYKAFLLTSAPAAGH